MLPGPLYPIRIVVCCSGQHEISALFSNLSAEFKVFEATDLESACALNKEEHCHAALLGYDLVKQAYGSQEPFGRLRSAFEPTYRFVLCGRTIAAEEANSAYDAGTRLLDASRKSLEKLPDRIGSIVNRNRSVSLRFYPRWPELPETELSGIFPDNMDEVHWVLSHLLPGTEELSYDIIKKGKTSAVLWGWQGQLARVELIKLGPLVKIQREVDHYTRFIDPHLEAKYYALLRRQFLWHNLGGEVYTFLGSRMDLRTFKEFYQDKRKEEIEQIIRSLRHLFNTTLAGFHIRTGTLAKPLYIAYNNRLNLDEQLSGFVGCPVVSGLPDPVDWVQHNKQKSDLQRQGRAVAEALTHGDLWGENILVEREGEHCWVIDYERTGPGHILFDFVELEVDILTRLVRLPLSDHELFLDLIVGLVDPCETPRSTFQVLGVPSRWPESVKNNEETNKAFRVVSELRRLAHKEGRYDDLREYYWGLLLDALFVASLPSIDRSQRERACLLGSVICARLENWKQREWLPSHWQKVTWAEIPQSPINVSPESSRNTIRNEGGLLMLPPEQQAALMVLTEATRFLFSELGKRLDFWRQKKGEKAPHTIEPKPDPDVPTMKFDDFEQAVNAEVLHQMRGSVETSLDILRRLTKELDGHRKQLRTDTLLDPKTRAWLENRIPELERHIDEEANRLQGFLERVYGKQ